VRERHGDYYINLDIDGARERELSEARRAIVRKKSGALRPPKIREDIRKVLIYFFFLVAFFAFLAAFFFVAIVSPPSRQPIDSLGARC
jgi:hypothetical protein